MDRRLRRVFVSLGFGLLASCGLRSTPDAALLCADESGDTEGDLRPGSCDAPIQIPYTGEPVVVRGRLGGCSTADGWCGSDLGPEDVYYVDLPADVDVTISVREAETTFSPTLRAAAESDSGDPCAAEFPESEVCAPDGETRESWSFFGTKGRNYIVVDSPSAASNLEYALDVRWGGGQVPKDCPVFPEVITLGTGGVFAWQDTLARGQGVVDSKCQAPGAEHYFQLNLKNSGLLRATVEGDGTVQPVVGVRNSCATATEFSCAASGGGVAVMEEPVDGPSTVFLVVDQATGDGGSYSLTVEMF